MHACNSIINVHILGMIKFFFRDGDTWSKKPGVLWPMGRCSTFSRTAEGGPFPPLQFGLPLLLIYFHIALDSLGISPSFRSLKMALGLLSFQPWIVFLTLDCLFLCFVNLYFTFVNRFLYLLDSMDLSFQGPYHLLLVSLFALYRLIAFIVLWAAGGQRLLLIHLCIGAYSTNQWKDQVKVAVIDNQLHCWGPVSCLGHQEGSLWELPVMG